MYLSYRGGLRKRAIELGMPNHKKNHMKLTQWQCYLKQYGESSGKLLVRKLCDFFENVMRLNHYKILDVFSYYIFGFPFSCT